MKLDRLNLNQSNQIKKWKITLPNYFHQKILITNHQTSLGHKNQAQLAYLLNFLKADYMVTYYIL